LIPLQSIQEDHFQIGLMLSEGGVLRGE